MKTYEEMLEELLSNPELLKKKQPFTRGEDRSNEYGEDKTVGIGVSIDAVTPSSKRRIVSQGTYLRELDPACHDVLFDENIPSLCVKLNDGGLSSLQEWLFLFRRLSRISNCCTLQGTLCSLRFLTPTLLKRCTKTSLSSSSIGT